MGPAGYKIPITPPASYGKACDVCKTDTAAWVKEKKDPIWGEGVIDINLCFAWWTNNDCSWERPGKGVACKDDVGALYHLYYLSSSPGCSMAYCAI